MKKQWIIRGVGILLFLFFVGYLYVYESYLHGTFNSKEVILAKDKIEVGTHITEANINEILHVVPYPRELITDAMITDPSTLLNKRTVSVIEANDYFSKDKLDESKLKETKDHRFFSIPSKWIESVPGSLRRLDEVDVWLIPSEPELAAKYRILTKEQDLLPEARNTVEQEQHSNVTTNNIPQTEYRSNDLNIANVSMPEELYDISLPILEEKVVAFIKNNSNTEVIGVEDKENRLDATSAPAVLELSLTDEEFAALKRAYIKGYKLVFSY